MKKTIKLPKITVAYIAKTALLSAIAFVLYMYGKFNLPVIFPSWLEFNFSELPALLAGFSMGPVSAALVIVIKCAIKMPFTSTAFVGELMDLVLGLAFVLPSSIIYKFHKDRKHALYGLLFSTGLATGLAMLFNWLVAIPFYLVLYFNNNFSIIINICSTLYPNLTEQNFYLYYIFVGVLPFNLLRYGIICLVTYILYKRLSKILHWEYKPKKKEQVSNVQELSQNDTIENTNNNINPSIESSINNKVEDENN